MAGTIKIAILADAANAIRGIRQTSAEAERATKGVGGFGRVLGGLSAVGAAVGIGKFFIDSFKGATEAARIAKVLNNQIANLGPTGKAAFAGVDTFATQLGNSIGQDDDDIKAVVAKLASFPDAFRAGSLGAEAMRRATAAAFDLQALGIGDAQSNILQIGKALNDPIKGMTALTKSGVSFSAEQKAQIANYVQQGKLADAQRVLLTGIESNAKGAAAAAASPVDKMRVALQNIGESIAGQLLPGLNKAADFISTKVVPAAEHFAETFGPKIGSAIGAAGSALGKVFDALQNPILQTVLVGILAIVAAMKVWTIATSIYTAAQWALNAALDANPIGLIVLAIVGLVAAIVFAYKKFPAFRKVVDATFKAVKNVITKVVAFLKPYVLQFLANVKKGWEIVFPFIKKIVALYMRLVQAEITIVIAVIKKVFAAGVAYYKVVWAGLSWLWDFAVKIFNAIKAYVSLVIAGIKLYLAAGVAVYRAIWAGIVWLFNFAVSIFNAIRSAIAVAVAWVENRIALAVAGMRVVWSGIVWLYDRAVVVFNLIKSWIAAAVDWVRDRINDGINGFRIIWGRIVELADRARDFRDRLFAIFTNAVTWLVDTGRDIVNGLKNGIANAWHFVLEKIHDLIQLIPRKIRDWLGISSPSKVTADIGAQIMLGLVKGIDSATPKLTRQLASVSSLVQTGLSASPTIEIGASGSAAGRGQTINVTVNVPVSSDPAEVGRQVVKTIRSYESTYGRTVLASAA